MRRFHVLVLVLLVGLGAFLVGMTYGDGPPRVVPEAVLGARPTCDGLQAEVDDLRQAQDRARAEDRGAPVAPRCPPVPACDDADALRLSPAGVLLEGAAAIPGLLEHWDEEAFRRLFPKLDDVERMREQFAWFRERLGSCRGPTPIAIEAATQTRFAFSCDGGVLEASLGTDDPHGEGITTFSAGIRDTPPPERVASAAQRVIAMIEDPDTASEGRLGDLMHRLHDGLGGCELQAVDLGGPDEALYAVECEDGIRRTLTVRIGDDGKIRGVKVLGLRRAP